MVVGPILAGIWVRVHMLTMRLWKNQMFLLEWTHPRLLPNSMPWNCKLDMETAVLEEPTVIILLIEQLGQVFLCKEKSTILVTPLLVPATNSSKWVTITRLFMRKWSRPVCRFLRIKEIQYKRDQMKVLQPHSIKLSLSGSNLNMIKHEKEIE